MSNIVKVNPSNHSVQANQDLILETDLANTTDNYGLMESRMLKLVNSP